MQFHISFSTILALKQHQIEYCSPRQRQAKLSISLSMVLRNTKQAVISHYCLMKRSLNDQGLFSEHHKKSHIQLERRSRSPTFQLFQRFLIGLPNNAVSILGAASRGVHASLAGNVFSTQKRLADETTYEHTRICFSRSYENRSIAGCRPPSRLCSILGK